MGCVGKNNGLVVKNIWCCFFIRFCDFVDNSDIRL